MTALSRARVLNAVHLAPRVSTVMKAANTKTAKMSMDMIVNDNTKEKPVRTLGLSAVVGFT